MKRMCVCVMRDEGIRERERETGREREREEREREKERGGMTERVKRRLKKRVAQLV
jgi:hypothetical protein